MRHQLGRNLRFTLACSATTPSARCSATSAASRTIRGGHVYPARSARLRPVKPIACSCKTARTPRQTAWQWNAGHQEMPPPWKFAK